MNNEPLIQTGDRRLGGTQAFAARSLWRAVLFRAIRDLGPIKDKRKGERSVKTAEQNKAHAWFNLNNPDFVAVCELADVDEEKIMKAYEAGTLYDALVLNQEEEA